MDHTVVMCRGCVRRVRNLSRASWCVIVGTFSLALHMPAASGIVLAQQRSDVNGSRRWVGTWATSPQASADMSFENQSLRMIVRSSVGGSQVRVRFSNAYGAVPLDIGSAHIALREPCTVEYAGYRYQPGPPAVQPPPPTGTCATLAGSAIKTASDRALTFGGSRSARVFPGTFVVSDPVDLSVPAPTDLAVSFFLPNRFEVTPQNLVTRHAIAKQTNYISAAGTGDLTGAALMPEGTTLTLSWYFLNTVEVLASSQTGVIVAFGDSITDANVSTPDMNFRWPDELAKRLRGRAGSRPMGVLNHGTGGDRVLWDAPAPPMGSNDSGMRRFDRDVIAAPGVTHVIVLLGVNDLRNGAGGPDNPLTAVTADEVIAGYKQMIARAHASGLKIYGATLLPWWESIFTNDNWTPQKWEKHQTINQWIRTNGAFDAVIDFDKCVADPSDPRRMLRVYDSGDHLHPNDRGYVRLSECVDLSLFQ